MTALRYDPYLWVHLAGLATVPLWLALCLLGLAVDYPTAPALELCLIAGVGVAPILLMQLRRPFCIFGLVFLALKPETLGEDQRRLLTVFRSWRIRLISPLIALLLVWCLFQLYQVAPVATTITPFSPWGRMGGLAVATVSFAGANLFLQVPASVLGVLATPDAKLQATLPHPVDAINRDFSNFGLPVRAILPVVIPPASAAKVQTSAPGIIAMPSNSAPEDSSQAQMATTTAPRQEKYSFWG